MDNSFCNKCNKTFRDIYELKRHQNKKFPCDRYEKITENGKIKYKCSYCKKIFSGLQSANYHQNHSCDSIKNDIFLKNKDNKNNNLNTQNNSENKLFDFIEISTSNNSILKDSSQNTDSNNILSLLLEQLKIQNEKILKLESRLEEKINKKNKK